MLGKTVAVLALAASCLAVGVPPSLAGSKSKTAAFTGVGWYDTDSNAAHSRANPAEKVLTPAAVAKVKYLRSVVAPPASPRNFCGPQSVAAPLPYGGSLYAITDGTLSKYNPTTGKLIWRRTLVQTSTTIYNSLAISGNLVIVGGIGCESASEPGGIVDAYNATTGALVWKAFPGTLNDMVKVGAYVITAGSDAAGYGVSVLNVSNGKPAWSSFDCGNGADPTRALVVGLLVMSYGCGQNGERIEANNLATGAVAWSLTGNWTLQRGDQSGSSGQHLYVTDPSGAVEALNPHTGHVQYSLNGAATVLAVDSSRAYATCGSGDLHVCAYNISTGAREWQSPDLETNTPLALAAEADGVLYVETGAALNAATGKGITTVWGSTFGVTPPATALAVGDGRIAVVVDPRVIDLYGLPGY